MKGLLLTAIIAITTTTATAQPRCLLETVAIYNLSEKYRETVQETITRPHSEYPDIDIVIEMWANEETGTWTLTGRSVDGFMCIFGAGADYEGQSIRDLLKFDVEV